MHKTLAVAIVAALASHSDAEVTNLPQDSPPYMAIALMPVSTIWRTITPVNGSFSYASGARIVAPAEVSVIGSDGVNSGVVAKFVWLNTPIMGTYFQEKALSFSVHDLSLEFGMRITDLAIFELERTTTQPLTQKFAYTSSTGHYRIVTLPRRGIPEPGTRGMLLVGALVGTIARRR